MCTGFLYLRRAGATLHCSAWASHCGGFSLRSMGSRHMGFISCGSCALERRLSSCGAWASLLCGMWDLPGPGLEPVSPALAGGFLTTVPPGKSLRFVFLLFLFLFWLPWLGLPKLCWIIAVRVDILVLFLILEEMLSVFHHWEWCLLWVCRICPLLCWGRFPLCPCSGEFLS